MGKFFYLLMLAYKDYYPFGMPMPNRNLEGDYRYKFQGQEKDPETGMEAFELRLWDSRIGRWMSPDPFNEFFSPYIGMGNIPTIVFDPDGGRIIVGAKIGGQFVQYEYRQGKFYDLKTNSEIKGITNGFFATVKNALGQITNNDPNSYGASFINTLERGTDNYLIRELAGASNTLHNIVNIDPSKQIETYLTSGLKLSPFYITLAHELGHAYGNVHGESNKNQFWYNLGGTDVFKSEIYASTIENVIRKEQGLDLRKYYSHYTNTRQPYNPSLLLPNSLDIFRAPVFFNLNNSSGKERVLTPRFF
ncbi:RHS repeat-associated core domain-containing protein [Aequorivita sp. CIP111184]|uniref:RHS repeat-associated core domain-containing protein n=1 Tax=Aequorivita sp. CIP111184 TaxID=2211356 RepID=UPI000DBC1D3A|nr:RHS repeat-associated core domain-containing protein [Aequorivita sp. CIP111184]SRX52256.1 hypothetical protein AEQU1_00119 [Aequorivita sp. CIP111184]